MTNAVITLATPLSELLESPRVLKTLAAAEILTIGDVHKLGLPALAKLNNVGEVTLRTLGEALASLAPKDLPKAPPRPPVAPREPDVEEGPHPIHLQSPWGGFRFPMRRALRRIHPVTGETETDASVFVEFEGQPGEGSVARVSKLMWFLKKLNGDRLAAEQAADDASRPWRAECAAWLRTRRAYKRDFYILSD